MNMGIFNIFNKKQEKNKKKIVNNIVDNNEKKQTEILKQIVEKSDKFFINNLFNALPDIYYGSDALEMFLTTAEIKGKEFGYTGEKLNNFVRDEVISQGYLFHKFHNEYIKENKMLNMISKYIEYIFPNLIDFATCFFNKAEIIRFNIIRLLEGVVWAGISGVDIRGLFESSKIPSALKSIIIYFNNLSIGIRLGLYNENPDLSNFSLNSEENRTQLRELILRNLKSFEVEYKRDS